MICVEPQQIWKYFEGDLGETADRQGGGCMDLSERCDAVLSKKKLVTFKLALQIFPIVLHNENSYYSTLIHVGAIHFQLNVILFLFILFIVISDRNGAAPADCA